MSHILHKIHFHIKLLFLEEVLASVLTLCNIQYVLPQKLSTCFLLLSMYFTWQNSCLYFYCLPQSSSITAMFWIKHYPDKAQMFLCKIKLPKPLQFNKNQRLQESKKDWGMWTLISTCSYIPWIKYVMISTQQLPVDELTLASEAMKSIVREASCSSRGISIAAHQCSTPSTI